MDTPEDDTIRKVEIDSQGQLCVYPMKRDFPYIYREAMEVHWDSEKKCLYSPVPREWEYSDWYRQIVAAAESQGCTLIVTTNTDWYNISDDLKMEMVTDV